MLVIRSELLNLSRPSVFEEPADNRQSPFLLRE
jgi:hypothetical protein